MLSRIRMSNRVCSLFPIVQYVGESCFERYYRFPAEDLQGRVGVTGSDGEFTAAQAPGVDMNIYLQARHLNEPLKN